MHRAIAIALFLYMPALYAANPGFMHDVAPISDFNKEDGEMFWNAVYRALDSKNDGEKLAWKNDKTGNSGLVNPLSTYQDGDIQCRDLRIINRSTKSISESKYKFCKRDGKWIAIEMILK